LNGTFATPKVFGYQRNELGIRLSVNRRRLQKREPRAVRLLRQ